MNILFICSRNQWRSPTGEAIFKNSTQHSARSAGTADSARIKVTERLLNWADIIFVMEKRHKEILQSRFSISKQLVVLDIPDEYEYMDEELVQMITSAVSPYLKGGE